jgi:opacity protein-like surface antigen
MKVNFTLVPLSVIPVICLAQEDGARKNELAFGLGGIPALSRSDAPSLDAGSGVAFQVNYGRRFLGGHNAALYGEINFLASPTREVSSSVTTATHDFASLYVTPGIRLKFLPASRISPYAVAGGGYADYEQSTTRIDGRTNPVSRQLARGVLDFGVGVDVRVWRFVALRGEARDFFTGPPAYNIPSIRGGQHNVVATGGFGLCWH